MASRVLVKKIKMRVPAGKATAAPPVGPALGARTRHRRFESDAEQFDSFDDAIIPHSTGQSTPTEVKGSATESELRLSVAGQAGVNLMDFCKLFNARTAKYKEGLELPVKLQAYNDRTFDFTVATPPASYFLKAAVRNPTPISVSSCPFWYWTAVGDFAHHFVWLSESKRVSDCVSHFERHECRPPQLVRNFLRALRRSVLPNGFASSYAWTSLEIGRGERRSAMPVDNNRGA